MSVRASYHYIGPWKTRDRKRGAGKVKQIPHCYSKIQGSRLNKEYDRSEHEVFSQLRVPPETPFFVRLDGRRFQAISDRVGAKKPFDEGFAKCLVASTSALFRNITDLSLAYVVSDEVNALFFYDAPFKRRVEKTNSVLASVISSAFALSVQTIFGKPLAVSFDSRIVVLPSDRVAEYLAWRQRAAWRNHNNAYAYWLLRRRGCKPSEAAKMLKGLKTKDIHEMLFREGINLAKTPVWQRRGILLYREPYEKQAGSRVVTRYRIKENWSLSLFSSSDGKALTQQILEWTKPHKGG